ncbi:MAG: hypothetical protein VX265_13565, partial [Myxococcota bacterium]|nr:hypothetical protein [Myxococcota bacterium]
MIRRIALLAPPLLGMACSPGPDGIWLLEVPWEDGGGCETSITEDFTAGYVPGEAAGGRSDWTYSDSYEGADSLRFVQIETYGDGTAVLVVGDEAYPGVQAEDSWVFSFEKKTTETDSADHASGYFWEIVQTSQSDSTYTFSFQSRERA